MIIEEKDYLEHFGIKGMHWGTRKNREASGKDASPRSNKGRNVALILGGAAFAATLAVGGVYAKKHFGVKLSDIPPESTMSAKKVVDDILHEPISVIHATRGKERGFGFLANGGLKDPLREWDHVGNINEFNGNQFQRYGKNLEKAAVVFDDPHGRKDAAGRVIPHLVILPKEHAKDVHDFEGAKKKAWNLVKDDFNSLYDSPFDSRHG